MVATQFLGEMMRVFLKAGSLLTTLVLGIAGVTREAPAADAEWGCQILLCAASENPSWHGVPYCVPPMKKLIAAMAKPGFSWPVCTGAGTGEPGHERYDDCPAGYTPARSDNGDRVSSDLDVCTRTTNTCGSGPRYHDDNCTQVEMIARPVKAKPYYFDIPQRSGELKRSWFDLNVD